MLALLRQNTELTALPHSLAERTGTLILEVHRHVLQRVPEVLPARP